ncbi:FYVE, RhoGEF and PH domain-containing protein 6-like isoform X2 [Anneissia japonica]|uniref:FYVE, RhoGEF and PH domain-containing protein 6-like isoform X2 n=1 Tax=Anneissia japonica TaxID=1529436 RepID=UPI0014255088|nr:FYVE, RhoGEF and PH domain-containing protein 6-like isoform X2 [Anneissia japonica]
MRTRIEVLRERFSQNSVSVNQTKPPVKPKPNISKFILNRIRNADFKNSTVRYSSQSALSHIPGENDERTTQSMFIESTNDSDFTNLKNETRNTVIVAEVKEKEEEADKAKNSVAINEDVKICESIVRKENINKDVNEKNDVNEEITETYEVSETVLEDSTSDVADGDTCIEHTGDDHPYANIDFSLEDDNDYVNLEPGSQFANQCSSAKRNSQEPSSKLPIPPPRRSKSLLEQASKTNEKKQIVKKTKKNSPVHVRREKRQQHCLEHSQSLPESSQFLEANHNSIVDPERPYSNIRPTPIRRQKKFDKSNKEIYAESAKRQSNRTSSNSPVAKRKEKNLSAVKKNKSKLINESSRRQRTISANSALDPKLVEKDSPEKSKPPVKPKPPKRKSRKERSKTMTPVVPEQVLSKENDTDNARSSTLTAPPRKNRSRSVEVVSKDTFDLPSSAELKIKPMPELSSKQSSENINGSIYKTNYISGNPTKKTTKQKSHGSVARPCRPAPPPPVKSKSCDSANIATGTFYSMVNDATYAVVNKNRKDNLSKSKTESGIKGEGSDARLPSTPHKVISDLHTFSFPSDKIDSTKVAARMSAEIEASAGPEVTDNKENTLESEVLENATVEQLKSPLSRDNSGSSGRGSFHSSENRNSGEGNRNSGLSDDYVLPDIKPLDTNKDEQIYVNQIASPDLHRKITYPSPVLGTRSIPIKPNESVDDQSEIELQDGYEDMSKFARKQNAQNIYSVPRACNHTPTEDGKCECADFTDSSGDEDGGSLSDDEIEEYGNYEPISELTQSGKHIVEHVEMTPEHRRKVLLVANEVRDSERVFVDVLKLLNEDFRSAIEHASFNTSRPVIDEKVLDQILGQLPQLQMFNEDLLDDLDKRIEEWDENPRLADIFLKKGPYLKLYTTYIRDFERLCAIFDEACTKYSFFGQVVRDFEASPRCMHLALKHYMLKPIQRIPQYKLLLTDYLKKLNPGCEDYSDTQAALKIVSEVANHANETMKQGDNFEKLLQIQHSLMGNHEIVKPGRIFKKEGILLKLSRKVMQPRRFFLMSDCLLYTTPYPSGQYKLNNELSLAGMKVSRPVQEDFQNEFSIISVQRSFTLSASTPELLDEWIDALMTAITDYAQKKSSFNLMRPDSMTEGNLMSLGRKAPVWIPDGRVTMCMICTCEFTITWRRHHCRACGKVVCGNCSNNKLPLSYLSKVARCCDECYSCLKEDCPEEDEKEDETLNKMMKKKKNTTKGKKTRANRKMSRPSALKEVAANECNITMSGYLFQKGAKKQWKRYWYVIKDKVLYTYKASEDVAALESMPLLGYDIRVINEYYDGVEAGLVLQLFHQGRQIRMFRTESKVATEKWRDAMHSATIL